MLQHVAIIVRSYHVEERVSNEEILGYHCFKNDRVTFWMPIVLPYQENGQFFYSQCMQSMLANIPENPLEPPIAMTRAVLSAFGPSKLRAEHCHNCFAKLIHCFKTCGYSHASMFINKINKNSIHMQASEQRE
jgi:hypothetical protein